jgi:tRNA threonylcarbamoyladenosine biosynthesis protein TsaB
VKLLAIDAATEACSAALLAGGSVHEREVVEARSQSALLLPMIDAVLAEGGLRLRDLDALAVGCGPGSFTGVRLAVGVAQGLALGAGLPVIPVSDLAMLAQGAAPAQESLHYLACLDARMGEVYWCTYGRDSTGLVAPLHAERLSAPGAVSPPGAAPLAGIGSGWERYPELRLRFRAALVACDGSRRPHARDALALAAPLWTAGGGLPPERVAPVYLREQVAVRPRS